MALPQSALPVDPPSATAYRGFTAYDLGAFLLLQSYRGMTCPRLRQDRYANRDLDSKASAQLDAGRSGRPHPRGYPGHKLHVEQGPRRPRTGGLLRLRRGQSAGTLIRHAPGVAKEAATTQR